MTTTRPDLVEKRGMPPTPPVPRGLPKIDLTDNARQVLERRYVRRGPDGKPAETVEEMFWRVAYHVAKVDRGPLKHLLYVGRIGRVSVTGSRFHDASLP